MDKRQATSNTQMTSKGRTRRIRPKANQRQLQNANTNTKANSNANGNVVIGTNDNTKRNQSEPTRNRQKLALKGLVLIGLNEGKVKSVSPSSGATTEKTYSSRNIIASNFNQKGHSKQPKESYKVKSIPEKSGSEDDELRRDPLGYNAMIDENDIDDYIKPFLKRFGLDDIRSYIQLNSCSFVREVDGHFYCALCCQRFDSNISPDDHLTDTRHVNRYLGLKSKLLNTTPSPDSMHMIALQHLMESWIKTNQLTDTQIAARFAAIDDFADIVNEIDARCQCRIIGSLLAGSSLIDSDINLELLHPNSELFQSDPRAKNSIHHKLVDPDADYGNQINNHTMHYDLISNAVDTLYKIATFIDHGYLSVKSFTLHKKKFCLDLNAKVPKLVLLHQPTNVLLEVWCHAESSHQLACLLRNYMSMDSRARDLSILVKRWARICQISNPTRGTFTPETFVILVIHFLQRVQPPVLPCLHDLFGKNDPKPRKQKDNMTDNSAKSDGTIPSDSDANDEPTKTSDAEKEAPENNTDTADDAVEEEAEVDEIADYDFDQKEIDELNWRSENLDPVHKLFVDFLKFSMEQFAHPHIVISIRTLKRVTVSDKKWATQVKTIENPVKPSINMSKNIGSIRTYNYIRNCFSHGYYYLTSLPMVEGLKCVTESRDDPTSYTRLYINKVRFDFYFSMRLQKIGRSKGDLVDEMMQQELFARDVAVVKELVEHSILHGRHLETIPLTVAKKYDERLLMPRDRLSTTFCWLCRGFGHEKKGCARGKVMTISQSEIDPFIDDYVDCDEGFLELWVNDMIPTSVGKRHEAVVRELGEAINKGTGLDCCLELFGSTVNLLGCADSDLDICMTLKGHPSGRGVDCVKILKKTCKVLRKNRHVKNTIEPILAARVPIIKFKYDSFDVDLSMYNQCAIHNSKLLRSYVMLDSRVPQLCYLVKRFAKSCGIADASRGSLSSYAWSLMTIHFLQQTEPPILPVLQETSLEKKPIFGVNGWNVWFNDKFDGSPTRNDTRISLLFKEFLLYYTTFDFNQYVISIRTSKLITKFQKNWTYCMIAIEDPFELTYNLSGRLDDSMALYIMNSFPKAYRFITSFQKERRRLQDFNPRADTLKMIFNGQAIMRCEPPNRGCRFCQKIGHRVKDCPKRRPTKPREDVDNGRNAESKMTPEVRKDRKNGNDYKQEQSKSKSDQKSLIA